MGKQKDNEEDMKDILNNTIYMCQTGKPYGSAKVHDLDIRILANLKKLTEKNHEEAKIEEAVDALMQRARDEFKDMIRMQLKLKEETKAALDLLNKFKGYVSTYPNREEGRNWNRQGLYHELYRLSQLLESKIDLTEANEKISKMLQRIMEQIRKID